MVMLLKLERYLVRVEGAVVLDRERAPREFPFTKLRHAFSGKSSEQFSEFFNSHPGLFDDRGERACFEVFIVIRDRNKERRIVRMFEMMMAA